MLWACVSWEKTGGSEPLLLMFFLVFNHFVKKTYQICNGNLVFESLGRVVDEV